MRFLLLFHAAVSALLVGAVALAVDPTAALSTLFGAFVSLLNLIFLVITWPRILAKKQVALAVGAIVFKFALLGWILYFVVRSQAIRIGWFSTGLGVVIVSVLATSIFVSSEDEREP